MDSNEFIARVLRGSDNIDIMRQTIWRVVSILFGYKCKRLSSAGKKGINETFSSITPNKCDWKVSIYPDDPGYNRVQCIFVGNVKDVLYGLDNVTGRIETEHVQFVYENLHVFVKGMIETFPALNADCKPLIEASRVNIT